MERRLAAILAADVVGYSRLIGVDETETLNALRTLLKELVEPTLKRHHGRVVKLMGDGLLAEFSSVVDAVSAAVEIQEATPERSAHLPEDRRIALRIGVNLGDVVVEGRDLLGDGVNIAARLQEVADPDGVAVSNDAYRQLRGKLDLPFEDAGEKSLKNIVEPIRTWLWSSVNEPNAVANSAPSSETRTKPSIAILPFTNLSGDPEQEYFADGMSDDLITDLSLVSGLVVAARTSSFAYKGKFLKMQEIGKDLGVDFLLEGSIRRAENQVRINAQLIDSKTGMHLWAETFDRAYANIFALQDEVTGKITEALKVTLTTEERINIARPPTNNIDAYDYFLKAEELRQRPHVSTFEPVFTYYDEALALDPDFLDAHIGHAQASFWAWHLSWLGAIDPLEAKRRALGSIEKALDLDPANAKALALKVEIQIWLCQQKQALQYGEKVAAFHPGDPDLLLAKAFALTVLGQVDEARAEIAQAEALSVTKSSQILHSIFKLSVFLGDYEKAIAAASEYRGLGSSLTTVGILPQAVSYAGLGEFNKAKEILMSLDESWSWVSLAWERVRTLHICDDLRNPYLELLKKVGVPEWPHDFQGDPALRVINSDLETLFLSAPALWRRIPPRFTKNVQMGQCDGNGSISFHTHSRSGKLIPISGTLTIKNDMLHMTTESMLMGREICAEVYRNPEGCIEGGNEFLYINLWGKTYFSIEQIDP